MLILLDAFFLWYSVRQSFYPTVDQPIVYIGVQVNFVVSEIESNIVVRHRNCYKSKSNLNLNLGMVTLLSSVLWGIIDKYI